MSSVYLAGPIAGLSYAEATDWREFATSELRKAGIVGISPMRHKTYLAGENKLPAFYENMGYVLSTNEGITTRDRFDVMHCDVVLMNFLDAEEVSKGTFIEVGWADAYRKPIVLVMRTGNVNDHPMLRALSPFVVSTLEDGLEVVKAILSPYRS